MKDFARLREGGLLDEMHARGLVIISCGMCATQWERQRGGGRRETVQERTAARDHVLTQHNAEYHRGSR